MKQIITSSAFILSLLSSTPIALAQDSEGRPNPPSPDEIFSKVDKDGNGSISLAEFLAGPGRHHHRRPPVDGQGPDGQAPDARKDPQSDAHKAQREEKLTAIFKEAAGDKSELSKDQFLALVKTKLPHRHHHRIDQEQEQTQNPT